jgi:hypothetical protein
MVSSSSVFLAELGAAKAMAEFTHNAITNRKTQIRFFLTILIFKIFLPETKYTALLKSVPCS